MTKFKSIAGNLFLQLVLAIIAGITIGALWPEFGSQLKPLGDGFIKLIKMIIAPLVFVLVTIGIARMNDLAKLGRIGGKTIVYFTAVTSFALIFGMLLANIFRPGDGFDIPPETMETGSDAVSEKTDGGSLPGATEFILGIIPDSAVGAFADAELLQVLLLAILAGIALAKLRAVKPNSIVGRAG